MPTSDTETYDRLSDLAPNNPKIAAELKKAVEEVLHRKMNQDPTMVAAFAPPWFAEREFRSLHLPTRVQSALNRAGVRRISDLASYSLPQLLLLPNFGSGSVKLLVQQLKDAMREGPYSASETPLSDIEKLHGLKRHPKKKV